MYRDRSPRYRRPFRFTLCGHPNLHFSLMKHGYKEETTVTFTTGKEETFHLEFITRCGTRFAFYQETFTSQRWLYDIRMSIGVKHQDVVATKSNLFKRVCFLANSSYCSRL